MNNINDFIKLLDTTTQEVVDVYIPSKSETVKCKIITVAQQKEVIKSTLNGIKGNISLPKIFNNIVISNIQQDIVPLVVDKMPILIQLRLAALGNVIYDDSGEQTSITYEHKKVPFDLTTEIEDHGIKVILGVPDLKRDNEYYNILENITYDNAGDIVNDMYVFETAKYIKKIEFQEQTAEPTVRDSIQLVNKLPLSLNDKILKYIKKVKDYENNILTADNGKQITLNARFFNTTE